VDEQLRETTLNDHYQRESISLLRERNKVIALENLSSHKIRYSRQTIDEDRDARIARDRDAALIASIMRTRRMTLRTSLASSHKSAQNAQPGTRYLAHDMSIIARRNSRQSARSVSGSHLAGTKSTWEKKKKASPRERGGICFPAIDPARPRHLLRHVVIIDKL